MLNDFCGWFDFVFFIMFCMWTQKNSQGKSKENFFLKQKISTNWFVWKHLILNTNAFKFVWWILKCVFCFNLVWEILNSCNQLNENNIWFCIREHFIQLKRILSFLCSCLKTFVLKYANKSFYWLDRLFDPPTENKRSYVLSLTLPPPSLTLALWCLEGMTWKIRESHWLRQYHATIKTLLRLYSYIYLLLLESTIKKVN